MGTVIGIPLVVQSEELQGIRSDLAAILRHILAPEPRPIVTFKLQDGPTITFEGGKSTMQLRDDQWYQVSVAPGPDDRGNPTTFQNARFTLSGGVDASGNPLAAIPLTELPAKDDAGNVLSDTSSFAGRRYQAQGPLCSGVVLTVELQDAHGNELAPITTTIDVIPQDAVAAVLTEGTPVDSDVQAP